MSYFSLHQLCQDQKSKLGHLNMGIQTAMANVADVHQTNVYAQGMNVFMCSAQIPCIHSLLASFTR